MTEYIKKHYRLILMSVFAALVCFGYQAFNSNIRIDTEELINHPGSTLGWLTIGRFGLVLLKRMLGSSRFLHNREQLDKVEALLPVGFH